MAVAVLKSQHENEEARGEMRRRGIDCSDSWLTGILRKYGLLPGMNVGDLKKSWDVLKTTVFLEQNLTQDQPILDIGAFRSEILPILLRLNFYDLTGIDLDPKILQMPGNDRIRYQVADCYSTPFADGAFAAVTAISVLEHGFNRERLLAELSRIIRPGGFFVASVDYWPDKIDTLGIEVYGMNWSIFSREDVLSFIADAAHVGFRPVGEVCLEPEEQTVDWMGKKYTFAWLALQKNDAD